MSRVSRVKSNFTITLYRYARTKRSYRKNGKYPTNPPLEEMTNAELARRLSITQATLWDRLNNRKGRRDIPVSLLSEMLTALDCKVVILDGDDQYAIERSCETNE